MSEYLPDKRPKPHRKHSTASPSPRSARPTGRPARSSSTVEGGVGGGGGDHGTVRPRRQSAYPPSSRPSPAAVHARRRQHSIAYPPRRSTFFDDRFVDSPGSRQFPPSSSTASPSAAGLRHSRTEPLADQAGLLPVGNHVSSRSSNAVDEVVGRSRRCAGCLPSTTAAGRLLSPFEELDEPSPTSLSRSSTSRGDSGSSPAPPLHDGLPGQWNSDTADLPAPPPSVVLHVSADTRADLVDIRSMLASYMKRLADKDAAASATKEWRIVAKVFDRLFFYLYCATILFSLWTIFPWP